MSKLVASLETAVQHLPKTGGHPAKPVADELKALRRAENLSQRQFCDRYGIPLASLQNWESVSRASNPDATALLLIGMIKADRVSVARLVEKVKEERLKELA
jgi:DNA-binding transcriptional regulator YiaG